MATSTNDRTGGTKDSASSAPSTWKPASSGKGTSRTASSGATTEVKAGPATLKGAPVTTGTKGAAKAQGGRGPRRIRLTLARLDPFSVMKLSFLLSIGLGIATVIAVALLWTIVDSVGLWDSLNTLGKDLGGDKAQPILDMFAFSKMLSYATVVAVVNIVIITALGTLASFLYNIVASLLGGLKMTFTDQ